MPNNSKSVLELLGEDDSEEQSGDGGGGGTTRPSPEQVESDTSTEEEGGSGFDLLDPNGILEETEPETQTPAPEGGGREAQEREASGFSDPNGILSELEGEDQQEEDTTDQQAVDGGVQEDQSDTPTGMGPDSLAPNENREIFGDAATDSPATETLEGEDDQNIDEAIQQTEEKAREGVDKNRVKQDIANNVSNPVLSTVFKEEYGRNNIFPEQGMTVNNPGDRGIVEMAKDTLVGTAGDKLKGLYDVWSDGVKNVSDIAQQTAGTEPVDDTLDETLSRAEEKLSKVPGTVAKGVYDFATKQAPKAWFNINRAVVENIPFPGEDPEALKEFKDDVAGGADMISDYVDKEQQERMKELNIDKDSEITDPLNFAYQSGSGAASLGLAMGTGILSKSTGVAASLLGSIEGAGVYQESKKALKEKNPDWSDDKVQRRSLGLMAVSSGGIAALEKLGLDALFRSYGGSTLKKAGINMITESTQEGSQSFYQNLVTKYGYDSEQALGEEVFDAMFVAAPLGFFGGATTGSMVHLQKAETQEAQQAEQDKQTVQEFINENYDPGEEVNSPDSVNLENQLTPVEGSAEERAVIATFADEMGMEMEDAEQLYSDTKSLIDPMFDRFRDGSFLREQGDIQSRVGDEVERIASEAEESGVSGEEVAREMLEEEHDLSGEDAESLVNEVLGGEQQDARQVVDEVLQEVEQEPDAIQDIDVTQADAVELIERGETTEAAIEMAEERGLTEDLEGEEAAAVRREFMEQVGQRADVAIQEGQIARTEQGAEAAPAQDLDVLTESGQQTQQAFEQSENQETITQRDGERYVIGEYGRNALQRKADQQDRLPSDQLEETLNNTVATFRGSEDPSNFRYGNAVHLAQVDGQDRAVITRQNPQGQQEVINFFEIGRDTEQFIDNLGERIEGVPSQTRTDTSGLEDQRPIQLDDGDTDTVTQQQEDVQEQEVETEEERLTEDQIQLVDQFVNDYITDTDADAEVLNIAQIGSTVQGEQDADSDIDIFIEYEGEIREDSFFNAINERQQENDFTVNDREVDFTPVKVEQAPSEPNMETVREQEQELRSVYENTDGFVDEMRSIMMELELAEPGDIVMDGEGGIEAAWDSTFPDWIPEGTRTRQYADKALDMLTDDIASLRYPNNPVANRQRQFFDALFDEIDSRLGVDTADIRGNILNQYGEQTETSRSPQEARRRGQREDGRTTEQGRPRTIEQSVWDKQLVEDALSDKVGYTDGGDAEFIGIYQLVDKDTGEPVNDPRAWQVVYRNNGEFFQEAFGSREEAETAADARFDTDPVVQDAVEQFTFDPEQYAQTLPLIQQDAYEQRVINTRDAISLLRPDQPGQSQDPIFAVQELKDDISRELDGFSTREDVTFVDSGSSGNPTGTEVLETTRGLLQEREIDFQSIKGKKLVDSALNAAWNLDPKETLRSIELFVDDAGWNQGMQEVADAIPMHVLQKGQAPRIILQETGIFEGESSSPLAGLTQSHDGWYFRFNPEGIHNETRTMRGVPYHELIGHLSTAVMTIEDTNNLYQQFDSLDQETKRRIFEETSTHTDAVVAGYHGHQAKVVWKVLEKELKSTTSMNDGQVRAALDQVFRDSGLLTADQSSIIFDVDPNQVLEVGSVAQILKEQIEDTDYGMNIDRLINALPERDGMVLEEMQARFIEIAKLNPESAKDIATNRSDLKQLADDVNESPSDIYPETQIVSKEVKEMISTEEPQQRTIEGDTRSVEVTPEQEQMEFAPGEDAMDTGQAQSIEARREEQLRRLQEEERGQQEMFSFEGETGLMSESRSFIDRMSDENLSQEIVDMNDQELGAFILSDNGFTVFNLQPERLSDDALNRYTNFLHNNNLDTSNFDAHRGRTTRVIEEIRGAGTKSRAFFQNQFNKVDNDIGLRQSERLLMEQTLDEFEGDSVDTQEFINRVKTKLLPLNIGGSNHSAIDQFDLDRLRNEARQEGSVEAWDKYHEAEQAYRDHLDEHGDPDKITRHAKSGRHLENKQNVENYFEHVFETPFRTDVNKHDYPTSNYFAHARMEDLSDGDTRRIIEVQSDLFQEWDTELNIRNEVNPDKLIERIGEMEEQIDELRTQDTPPPSLLEVLVNRRDRLSERVEMITSGNLENIAGTFDVRDRADRIFNENMVSREQSLDMAREEIQNSIREARKIEQLRRYRKYWWERAIREEIKIAAEDARSTVRMPAGETAMGIQGKSAEQVENRWYTTEDADATTQLNREWVRNAQPGDSIYALSPTGMHTAENIIVSKVGDGNTVYAISKSFIDNAYNKAQSTGLENPLDYRDYRTDASELSRGELAQAIYSKEGYLSTVENDVLRNVVQERIETGNVPGNAQERLSGEVDISNHAIDDMADQFEANKALTRRVQVDPEPRTEHGIYRFYENQVGDFLQNEFEAEKITDENGQDWFELDVPAQFDRDDTIMYKTSNAEGIYKNDPKVIEERANKSDAPFDIDAEQGRRWLSELLGDEVDIMPFDYEADPRPYWGMFTPDGIFNNSMIRFATLRGQAQSDTIYHEGFHAAFRTFMSQEERQQMLDNVRGNIPARFTQEFQRLAQTGQEGEAVYQDSANERAEEWLANDFARYYRWRKGVSDQGREFMEANETWYETLFRRLRHWIRQMTGAQEVYNDIISRVEPELVEQNEEALDNMIIDSFGIREFFSDFSVSSLLSSVNDGTQPEGDAVADTYDTMKDNYQTYKEEGQTDDMADEEVTFYSAIDDYKEMNQVNQPEQQQFDEVAERMEEFTVDEETWTEKFRRKVQDQNARIDYVQQQLVEQGAVLNEDSNVFLAKTLMPRKIGDKFKKVRNELQEPLVEAVINDGLTMQELDAYAHALHAQRRNEVMQERGYEGDGGSGLTNEQAQEIIDGFREEGKLEDLQQHRETLQEIQKSLQAFMLENDLITREELKAWVRTYGENYVPLSRDLDFGEGGGVGQGTAPGTDVRGQESQRAFGSEQQVLPVTAQVFAQYERAIMRAEKNRVGQTLLNFIQDNNENGEMEGLFHVERQQYVPRFDSDGELMYMDPKYVNDDSYIGVKVDGDQYYIQMKDEKYARAMREAGLTSGFAYSAGFVRFLSSMITQYSPEFMLRNLQRDFFEGMINLQQIRENEVPKEERAQLSREVAKNTPGFLKDIYNYERGRETDRDAMIDRFKEAGGEVGYYWSVEVQQSIEDIEQLEQEIRDEGFQKIKNRISRFGDVVDSGNTAAELAIRASLFEQLVQRGVSDKRAAERAGDLTVDFNKVGEWGPAAKSLYVFINPAVQGPAKMLRAMSASRAVQAASVGMVAGGFLNGVISMMLGGGADDDIPEYRKNTRITFATPSGGETTLFYLPYGYNAFWAFGRNMAELAYGKRTVYETGRDTLMASMDSFNPLGGSRFSWANLAPSMIKPAVEIGINEAWHGGPTAPEQPPYQPKVPDSQLYWDSVSDSSKFIAKWLNRLSGGNERESGWIDVSPENIEYAVEAYGGTVFTNIQDTFDTTTSLITGQDIEAKNIPIVRNYYQKIDTERAKQEIIYEMLDEAGRTDYGELRTNRFMDALDAMVERGEMEEGYAESLRSQFKNNQSELETGFDVEENAVIDAYEKVEAGEMSDMEAKREAIRNTVGEDAETRQKTQIIKKYELNKEFGFNNSNVETLNDGSNNEARAKILSEMKRDMTPAQFQSFIEKGRKEIQTAGGNTSHVLISDNLLETYLNREDTPNSVGELLE